VKDGKGGINWYRHQDEVLKPHLLPFAKTCKEALPNPYKDTVVMEDGALAHKSAYSNELYISWEVIRMLWPANSPDLNMIEPCWFYIKIETTKKGAITLNIKLCAAWVKYWEELPQ
jgi:transposase